MDSLNCLPWYTYWAALIPVVAAIVLAFWRPKQITKDVDGKTVVDGRQFMMYLLYASAAGWALLAGVAYMSKDKVEYCVSRRILM